MKNIEEHFLSEVEKFRNWEKLDVTEKQAMEWECDYPEWDDLRESTFRVIEETNFTELESEILNELLYVLDADNNCEMVSEEITKYPENLLFLARAAIESTYRNAKWQLASGLGKIKTHKVEAEQLIFQFAKDDDEYTSRRALGALGEICSSRLIEFVESAWATNHEYQRIMALSVLQRTESPELEKYMLLAEQDGREYLVYNVSQIRSGHLR